MSADDSTGTGSHGGGPAGGAVRRAGIRTEPTDDELATRVARGDAEAFAALYRRHEPAASRVARRIVDGATAQDVVAESFARILVLLRSDAGAIDRFRPYLLTMVRNAAIDTIRRGRESAHDFSPASDLHDPEIATDPADGFSDRDTVRQALESLPPRWQTVLWLGEVEGLSRQEIADRLAIKPTAVSTLALRAREGLRRAYLATHLRRASGECAVIRDALPAYVRGSASPSLSIRIAAHLDACDDCRETNRALVLLNNDLAAVLVPLALTYALPTTAAIEGGFTGWLVARLTSWAGHPVAAGAAAAALAATAGLGFVALTGTSATSPLAGGLAAEERPEPRPTVSVLEPTGGITLRSRPQRALASTSPARATPPSAEASTAPPGVPQASGHAPTSAPTAVPVPPLSTPGTTRLDLRIVSMSADDERFGALVAIAVPSATPATARIRLVADHPWPSWHLTDRSQLDPGWRCGAVDPWTLECRPASDRTSPWLTFFVDDRAPLAITATINAPANVDPDPSNDTAAVQLQGRGGGGGH
ncbi:MAG: sigma-70 family RNA polymerase sigma factor [Nocardioidaceae bacterium]|nr:sigma-70 family RNA polymerase sigma factor [Nocardioidaceae bacterium]